jgi:hypothetical protein
MLQVGADEQFVAALDDDGHPVERTVADVTLARRSLALLGLDWPPSSTRDLPWSPADIEIVNLRPESVG